MKILTIDCATDTLDISVCKDGDTICETFLLRPRAQLLCLSRTIKNTLETSGLNKEELNIIAVTNGPGSFTGLRLAITTAKTIAQILRIEIASVNTLDAIACSLPAFGRTTAVALDARRDEIFAAFYEDTGKKRISDYKAFSKEDFSKELLSYGKNITVTGNALERYGEFLKNECPGNNILDKHFWYPRGYALACIAEKMAASGETKAFSEIDAFYMRKSEAEETRERKLKDGQ